MVELLTSAGLDVVGQVGDADALLDAVDRTHPDAIVLDIRMPPTHTHERMVAARAIRAEHGSTMGILLLSQ